MRGCDYFFQWFKPGTTASICAHLLGGPLLACHVLYAEVDQLLRTFIFEFAAVIAPFAVFLIERTVGFFADCGIVERHSAALAEQLPRRAQQRVNRNIEEFGKQLQRFHIRCGLSVFPAGHRLSRYEYLFRQFFLRQPVFRSQVVYNFLCVHQEHLPETNCSTEYICRQATRCCRRIHSFRCSFTHRPTTLTSAAGATTA